MTLNLDNIGAIRLVPYGGVQQVSYGFPDEYKTSTPSNNGTVDYSFDGNNRGMLCPNWADRTKPTLDFDNRVYVSGAKVVNADGETFSDGGYLGTVSSNFRFVSYADTTHSTILADESVTMDALGIIPSQYVGGVLIDNLWVTSGNWEPIIIPAWTGDAYHVEDSNDTFDWNGFGVRTTNFVLKNAHRANGTSLTRVTCVESGVIGMDLRITLRTLPLSSS